MRVKYLMASFAISLTLLLSFVLSSVVRANTEFAADKSTDKNRIPMVKLHPALLGKWKNQRGSTLEVTSVKNNVLTGTFTTAVAKTKECIGKALPLLGYVNGNVISLIVDLAPCDSPFALAMTGYVSHNKIHTMFLVQNSEHASGWHSRIINTDTYHREK